MNNNEFLIKWYDVFENEHCENNFEEILQNNPDCVYDGFAFTILPIEFDDLKNIIEPNISKTNFIKSINDYVNNNKVEYNLFTFLKDNVFDEFDIIAGDEGSIIIKSKVVGIDYKMLLNKQIKDCNDIKTLNLLNKISNDDFFNNHIIVKNFNDFEIIELCYETFEEMTSQLPDNFTFEEFKQLNDLL